MTIKTIYGAAILSIISLASFAQDSGEEVYQHWCSHCHDAGEGYAGTMMLSITRGEDLGVLKERSDLTPEYIKVIVRQGYGMMAPLRETEIPDNELDLLTQYLTNR